MRRIKTADMLSVGLLVCVGALTAGLYAKLPAEVPIHFNLRGVPDGWASRAVGAWLLPGLSLALWAFLRFSHAFVPASWRARLVASPTSLAALLVTGLFAAIQVVVLYAALHRGVPVGRILTIVLAVAWILLGQLLPRIRRNPFIGVRTPWTLSSDENWLQTHRVAAYAFAGGGLVSLSLALVGANALGAGMAVLVASALVPLVYSIVHAARAK